MAIANLQRILASTACPAFATDGHGRLLGLNESAQALLGYGSASIQGRRCREVFAGRDRFSNRFCLERCAVREMAARSEAVNPFDLCLKTASGTMLDVNISVVAVRDNRRKRPAILHLLRPKDTTVSPLCPDGNGLHGLTPREHQLLALLAAGKSSHDIARVTGISLATVRNHLKRIFPKLGVHSQAEAVSFAFRQYLT